MWKSALNWWLSHVWLVYPARATSSQLSDYFYFLNKYTFKANCLYFKDKIKRTNGAVEARVIELVHSF
jgi:hypothetical protein